MSDDTAIRLNALTNLVPELVDCDSAAAAKLVESLPTGESREELRSALIRAWATKDAASAFAWAAQLSDVDERNSALAGIVYRIAETTPADAIAVAQRYGLDNGDGEVLASLAMQWAGRNLNSALDWATRQPAGNSRDQMITRIAFVQAENSPRDAAELIVKEIPPGAAQQEAAISVLHQWLLQDLQAARAWVDQFPDSPLKQRAEAELENGARFLAADQTSAPD
jgi:hypothetical protein